MGGDLKEKALDSHSLPVGKGRFVTLHSNVAISGTLFISAKLHTATKQDLKGHCKFFLKTSNSVYGSRMELCSARVKQLFKVHVGAEKPQSSLDVCTYPFDFTEAFIQ